MAHENPPWELPAAGCARGSGSPGGRIGKPLETMGRKARGCRAQFAQCSFGCIRQTGGNVGTAKPEATARILCAMLVRLPNSLRPKMGKEGKIYYEKFKII